MPHGMCFEWQPNVLALHVVSDAAIALAYFSIPALLTAFVRRRPDIPFSGVFWMFAIFIVSCGATHVLSIWVIWHPIYWFEGWVKALTAVASVATAIALVPLLPKALALRSPRDLEQVNSTLQQAVAEREDLLQRYARKEHIAATYQDASLPSVPRRLGSLDISVVYRSATGELEVGGDWYDAFRLADGRVIVSIGDVAGKGLRAAVIMSKMRQAIRTAAQIQIEPAVILDAADKSLRLEYPDTFVTAFVGIIDEVEGTLAYASAGHPPPYVRTPAGSVDALPGFGLPLGLRLREESNDSSVTHLAAGSMLVLYSDGLTESTRDLADGEARFRSALEREAVELAPEPAREIAESVLTGPIRDDVAILTVRVGSSDDVGDRWSFDVGDQLGAARARNGMSEILLTHGATSDEIFNAEMIYGELIGNVLRYAPGPVDVRLDWLGEMPVLHVIDDGPGFQQVARLPSDMLAESGRGLFIVNILASDFKILKRPSSGSHARAVLGVGRANKVLGLDRARPAR